MLFQNLQSKYIRYFQIPDSSCISLSPLFILTRFKFSHLSSVVPCLKHCTSFSIFSKQFYLGYQTVQLPLFLLFPPWYFLQLKFNRIATRLWSESTSAPVYLCRTRI